MSSILFEVRIAARFLWRRKASSIVTVLTIGLALGVNTAVFLVLDALLFGSLGVEDAGRLYQINSIRELPGRGPVEFYNAWPAYELLRAQAPALSALGAVQTSDFTMDTGLDGEPRRLIGARATASVFAAWQVEPELGRTFVEKEEGFPAAKVAVIGHRLWQSAFAGDPAVIGRTLRLDGAAYTVVGVLPRGFALPSDTELWLPQEISPELRARGFAAKIFAVYGRLARGSGPAAVREDLKRASAQASTLDGGNRDWTFRARSAREVLLDGADRAVLLVQAAAVILLLLAIANLTAVQLAWVAARRRETALRLALGASTARTVAEHLAPALLLSTLGGGVGLLLAFAARPYWARLNPSADIGFLLRDLPFGGRSWLAATALVLAASVLAALLPWLQSRRTDLMIAMRGALRGATAARGSLRGQQAMAMAQAAAAAFTLAAAALVVVSFRNLEQAPMGFATAGRGVMRVQPPAGTYPGGRERARFGLALLAELRRHPDVVGAGLTTTLPVDDLRQRGGWVIEDAGGSFTDDAVSLHMRGISPGYLTTMAIPVLRGRDIEERDLAADAPRVALVSRVVAETYWPNGDPLGRRLRRTVGGATEDFSVVGVVSNVQDAGASGPAGETIYLPFSLVPQRRLSVVSASSASAASAITAARAALRAVDPALAAFGTAPLQELTERATTLQRFLAVLLAVFAAVAAGIAMLGAYGLAAQLVASRAGDCAVRIAIGARSDALFVSTLKTGLRSRLLGGALGLLLAILAAARWGALLFGLAGPWALCVTASLGAVALLELGALPAAWRGRRLDVAKALGEN